LTEEQISYVVLVIGQWLRHQSSIG